MPLSGKRQFSNNQDITFHDYLSNKKGIEIIKQYKSNSNLSKVNFLSYNDFNILTKAYSKNSNIRQTDMQSNNSFNDKTISLIYYEKIISHIKDCNYCNQNNKNIHKLLECSQIKSIINAYEHNFANNLSNTFQKKINLDRWCKNCDHSFPLHYEHEINNNDSDYYFEHDNDDNTNDNNDNTNDNDTKEYNTNKYADDNNDCNCPQVHIKRFSSGRKPIFCSKCKKFIDICNCSNRWSRVEAINRVNHKNSDKDSSFAYVNTKPLFVRK